VYFSSNFYLIQLNKVYKEAPVVLLGKIEEQTANKTGNFHKYKNSN